MDLTDSYTEAKQKGKEFATYKSTQKREWVSEKRDLGTLLGNIQTKLKTYNLKPYYPPEHLTLQVFCRLLPIEHDTNNLQSLDNVWYDLLQDEATYHRKINSKIRE